MTENGSSYRNGQKQNNEWQQSSAADANSPAARQEATNLVTAEATLTQTLDAKNAQTGNQISAKLQDKVQLKNGPELPKGTVLEGKVTADHVASDSARMAICFDTAKLNDGQTVPIKATVVGVARPQTDFSNSNAQMNGNNSAVGSNAAGQMNGSSTSSGTSQNSITGQMNQSNSTDQSNLPASTAYAATWTPNTLQVDQLNVVSGVDLHSRIHSKNSAVFVSQSKDDVKLDRGSQLTLAIGKQQSKSGMNASSPGL